MEDKIFLQMIKDEFPDLKWKRYRILTHGWDHVVIILDESIVFRFPKIEYYKKEFKNEIKLLEYLKGKINVSIPSYKYISKDKTFAGYEMLIGEELSISIYNKLSINQKENLILNVSDFLSTLHLIPISDISDFNIELDDRAEGHDRFIKDVNKYLFSKLNKKEIIIVQEYLDDLKTSIDNSNYLNILIHNDLTWKHILWDNEKNKVNIIDFSDRALGDPAFDFSGLWYYGEKFVNKVYDSYTGKKDDQFLERSKLYFKRGPLSEMIGSFKGYPSNFEKGYQRFKKVYNII